jgi:hypothetical protein
VLWLLLSLLLLLLQVLTKAYHMLDDDEPVLERSEGTEIDWKPGKNITVKVGEHGGGCAEMYCKARGTVMSMPWYIH